MAASIAQLKIYLSARTSEDDIHDLVKRLPEQQAYPLGNDLRRASAEVCYHLTEAHTRYSYELKLASLTSARQAAERTRDLLLSLDQSALAPLVDGYTSIIKQSWGFIAYLKRRRSDQLQATTVRAKDELVASRSGA